MHNAEDFLSWLQSAADKSRMSQADIARAMGVPPSTVGRWFAGSVPHRRTLEELRRTLEPGTVRDEPAAYKSTTRDGAMLEDLLTGMSDARLRDLLDNYMARAERDKEDRRAVSMARLLLSEINLRAKIHPDPHE